VGTRRLGRHFSSFVPVPPGYGGQADCLFVAPTWAVLFDHFMVRKYCASHLSLFTFCLYFGFGITLVSASIAHLSCGDGILFVLDPLIFLCVLVVSYLYFLKAASRTSFNCV
jgi:hypothetical protein